MRYEGPVFRPPSEADSLIVQATIGCSWNHCTYCAMYSGKVYRARPVAEVLAEIADLPSTAREAVRRVFLADGDALAMPAADLMALLAGLRSLLPKVVRISSYATARNLLETGNEDLLALRSAGLSLLYMGPESGDDVTLKALAKGADFADHVRAAQRAHAAHMTLSAIFLLGAGGTARSEAHAEGSARLITAMDPRYVSLLTLTLVDGTPLSRLAQRNGFSLPAVPDLLREARTIVAASSPRNTVFRCNHASNYLPLAGRLPRDRGRLLHAIDEALAGRHVLRPEWARGL